MRIGRQHNNSDMTWKKELWPEWQIEGEIGAGAFGKVYKIKRQDIGGTYYAALKVISVPKSHDELDILRGANMDDRQITEYYIRFADDLSREFSLMERLKGHSNIVSYEDHKIVPHPDGIGWDVLIRMELLTPLLRHLDQRGCGEQDVIKIGMDICDALIRCEQEGIIHRDIKPGNIFMSNHGDYKLGDFGIALTAAKARMERAAHGTFAYMAPEMYHGKRYDLTIDVYSLGLILYRLMNHGRAPFLPPPPSAIDSELVEEANNRRLRGEALPKPEQASSALAGVILKACAYHRNDRYQTAGEFKSALEKCLSGGRSLSFPRQVVQYVKKVVSVFHEMEDGTPDIFQYDTERKYDPGAAARRDFPETDGPEKEKMTRFFTAAGDL